MFTISVDANALKALTILASTDALRPHLVSVCIDTTTEGRVHLVSTNGHGMLVVGNATLTGDRVAGRFIVPLFDLKGAKPLSKNLPIGIEIEPGNPGRFTIHGKTTTTGTLNDNHFPDWQRVMPKHLYASNPGPLAHFNFEYVGDFGRVAELLGVKFPHIVHGGDASALVNLGANAFGILMPIRSDVAVGNATFVDWLEPVKGEERKAA